MSDGWWEDLRDGIASVFDRLDRHRELLVQERARLTDALARIDSLERRLSDAETVDADCICRLSGAIQCPVHPRREFQPVTDASEKRYEWEYRTINSVGEEVARGPAPAVWRRPWWSEERRKVGKWEPVEPPQRPVSGGAR